MPEEYHNGVDNLILIIILIFLAILILKFIIGCIKNINNRFLLERKSNYEKELLNNIIDHNLFSVTEEEIINIERENCTICFEKMNTDIIKTVCNHYFHTKCLKQWLESSDNENKNCPVCRSNLDNI